jgi:hypothetical protein
MHRATGIDERASPLPPMPLFLILVVVFVSLPCYVIAQRRSLPNAWAAFVPIFGPTIVLLWSIDPTWLPFA